MSKPLSLIAGLTAALCCLGAQAQQVIKDPLSGVLRGPTADEAQTLRPTPAPAPVEQKLAPKVSPRTGAIGTRLTDDHLSYAVVVRGDNGSLQHTCVGDKASALALVAKGQTLVPFTRPINLADALLPTE